MSSKFSSISEEQRVFIEQQAIFFVGTAAEEGRVNISPKGRESLKVLDANRIVWRNLTGSGNETASHLISANRITLMWCAFEGKPLILRCYGTAKVFHVTDKEFNELNSLFPQDNGARQLFDIQVDLVQTSCGFAVPLMKFESERDILKNWSDQKGKDGIKEYWKEKNVLNLDGKSTGIDKVINQ